MAIIFNISNPKANRSIRLFLYATILLFSLPVFSQPKAGGNLQAAYGQFLNLQLDSCSNTLEHISTDNPLAFYLEILLISTKIFIEDDNAHYKTEKYNETKLLEKLDELNFPEANTNFLKSEIKLQWAILKLKNGDEFAAFWNLKQAYTIARDNVNKNPGFLPSYKTLGLLHVLYGIFPDKYNWILSVFGIEGNVNRGLAELKKVYDSPHQLSLECGMTLALLQAYLLNDPGKGADLMSTIYTRNLQNGQVASQEKKPHRSGRFLLVDYAYALILIKNAQSETAGKIIAKTEILYPQPTMLPQLYYLKGEVLLQKGLLDEAIESYQVFISRQEGQDLVKDTYYKIGICYLIKGEGDKAGKYFTKSRQNGQAKNEADKNAENALNSTHISTKELYQLRYATDGGFYKKAFKIHEKMDTINLNARDKCEFYYRSARLFHKTGNTESAILNYKKTIKLQQNEKWYYAPNSALQLGLIYISENNTETAKKYLNLINEYSDYPYQNSIRQKAKTATRKLE